ncbi:hypothetical protein VW29_15470 [Devosia limi DSM 17137]|nr:TIGR03808 family TAT-translocated repetitive protein [Devosia limi]KKB82738.1 hypothetical protein VW29_15470 [Devosia limi DSM 17137]
MSQLSRPSRRHIVAALLALPVFAPRLAQAQSSLDATSLGVVGDSGADQSPALQLALQQAAAAGQTLRLPPGVISVRNIEVPGNIIVEGVPGRTRLTAPVDTNAAVIADRGNVVLRDIDFAGGNNGLIIEFSDDIALERCSFRNSAIGVAITDSGVTIMDSRFSELDDAAIHAMDSRGLLITGNRIDYCGNAGIRIWRSQTGPDRSIVSNNRIANIDWRDGGNGQNGNAINIFRADEVTVADNHLSDCAFTAVRLNTTRNTIVSGNVCLRSGEVAIFSEFAFSGSVIANNLIDGAATGISITNLDSGGHLATCTGNIVRNITPTSPVNPDTMPVGIFAEADTAITGNTVQTVPGVGIAAGYGAFLRNVLVANNVVSATRIGVGVSVVEGTGPVQVSGNLIHATEHAIAGLAWTDIVEPDLATNAGRFDNVSISGNSVGLAP